MKQKQITTGKATIVVVDMPEDVTLEEVNSIQGMINFQTRCLGFLSKIIEDQWKDIVDYFITDEEFGKDYVFRDYFDNSFFDTATESGLSLLIANGVILENRLGTWNGPYGRPQTFPDGAEFNSAIELYNFQKKWDKAQSEVWTNPYIFIKVK